MFDELLKLVTSESQQPIVNNPQVPNQHNETAIQTTTTSILESLKSEVKQGNGSGVLNLLGGSSGVEGNPITGNLTKNVTNSLMDKLGIDSPAAKQIAAALVPIVISKLVNRTNDPNDNGFDINSIFGTLTDGRSSGTDLSSLLGKQQGDQNGELGSIFNMLSGK